ncbi:MAG: HNH endonuclease [Rickettsiales bacterium]|jgi:hypothetical protein|nr:HNH endonuclease [Rickettsiales bacterium]
MNAGYDKRSIEKKRKLEQQESRKANNSFREFARNWNNNIRDTEQDDIYFNIEIACGYADASDEKAKKKSRYENWKNVKQEFLLSITTGYESKPLFCPLCGNPIGEDEEISPDHKNPRAHGGADTVENLQATHKDCNFRRGSNKMKEINFYDSKLKANVERRIYQDISRTSWNITFRYYINTPLIGVHIRSKTNDGSFSSCEIFYDIEGKRLNRKTKPEYYNHNPANYGRNTHKRKRGGR